ncbi:cell surface isoform A [Chlorella sorokiniana]|uniref:Cell surface isoform A n=1 Tax=Chlorella sorokiniana TaxID=3076 RepID=A0A2P6TEH9_CHLSO|nr:cell surface isoform B [Chlorella sorokiniana]PRW21032.1 cell surface isoform A [Chlorella sorokiniana]|eukprot:PRW21031.1 cell surface isoform B [Chlorella sorokiniana]
MLAALQRPQAPRPLTAAAWSAGRVGLASLRAAPARTPAWRPPRGTAVGSAAEPPEPPSELLLPELQALADAVEQLQADVTAVRNDVSELKTDLGNMRVGVSELKADFGNMKAGMENMKISRRSRMP